MKTKRIGLDKCPVELRVEGASGIFFVTIWRNGSLQIRPKGARGEESVGSTTIGSVYRRAILQQSERFRAGGVKP